MTHRGTSLTVSSAASSAPCLVPSNFFQIAAAIAASDAEHTQCGWPVCTHKSQSSCKVQITRCCCSHTV